MNQSLQVFHQNFKGLLFSLFFLLSYTAFGQKESTEAVVSKIDSLLSVSDYSGAQKVALAHLYRDSISDTERFQFWLIRAEIMRASGQSMKALEAYGEAQSYIPAGKNREVFLSLIQMKFAECFFDIPKYEKAAFHASESLRISPDTSMARTGHAINFLILGYVDFLDGQYTNSIQYYQDALNIYTLYGKNCDLPLVYTKMAKVANALGKSKQAISYIDKCKEINDSCSIKVYDILTYQTLFDIYKENGQYKEALETRETLGNIRATVQFENQSSEMAAIERDYKENLRKAEISSLLEVNKKNEIIKQQQNRFLWIALISIIGLTTLSLLLARSNKRRASAMKELEKLNRNLENQVSERTAHLRYANENIRLQSESIENRNTELTELHYMVAHDLRGPIGNLKMLVNFVKEASNESERKQFTDSMHPVLESLSATANQLLEKVDSSKLVQNDMQDVTFSSALALAKKGLQVDIESAQARISANFDQAKSVVYSKKYLISIFYNFLSNALKYRNLKRELQIIISTINDQKGILLRFEDNGLGIDMEKNGHRLFQLREVFHDRPDSKGVGLYMIKTQIERAGGKIWAESTLGVGTTFYVRFST